MALPSTKGFKLPKHVTIATKTSQEHRKPRIPPRMIKVRSSKNVSASDTDYFRDIDRIADAIDGLVVEKHDPEQASEKRFK